MPDAPSGWSGPFVEAHAGGGVSPAECTSDSAYPLEAYTGRVGTAGAAAECSCTCSAPSGGECSAPTVSLFTDNTCGASACHIGISTKTCIDALACDGSNKKVAALTIGPSTPTKAGSCEPKAEVIVPAETWLKSIRLCAARATAGDCEGGVCQPTPGTLFSKSNRCVIKSGDVPACPAAYPVRQVYHASTSDTRACSACTCAPSAGGACSGAAAQVMSGSCKDVVATLAVPNQCFAVASSSRVVTTGGTPVGGSCTPSGGESVGEVKPGPATTVCCLE